MRRKISEVRTAEVASANGPTIPKDGVANGPYVPTVGAVLTLPEEEDVVEVPACPSSSVPFAAIAWVEAIRGTS